MSKQNNAPSVSNAENVVDNGSLASSYPDKNEDKVPVAEILGNSSSSGSRPESVSTKEECVCDKEYLTDKEDTIEEYEKMAKSKREEKLKQQEGAEMNFLNTLDHVQKIEILSGIADMKNEFRTFLLAWRFCLEL
ncbi:hypothetical protein B296_00017945 [Ensete ventricosum]|uniref:No apical meristem-associated C-terminal domain-containing protein n=1 Tax=Ensete ventricosum TaxID=4639 RepID=A0A427B4B0_ENSVE|nr:hypothetical protein B296_00017945 [Ensete ventricosum]